MRFFSEKALQEEQAKIADGMPLLRDKDHPVRMIDTAQLVEEELLPFIADKENTRFAFDAEWDQSFLGEQGV